MAHYFKALIPSKQIVYVIINYFGAIQSVLMAQHQEMRLTTSIVFVLQMGLFAIPTHQ